jgi:hypothetical protein
MKRTVLASAFALALFGFGASPALADATSTTTEAAAPIPEAPSAESSGTGPSTALVPEQLGGPSSNGFAEAAPPQDSTEPTEVLPDHGPADYGSANNGTSNTGSSTGGKPGAGAVVSTDAPDDGPSAGEASASSRENDSAGAEDSAVADSATGTNGTDTNDADTTAPSDGTDDTSAADSADAAKDESPDTEADPDAPAPIDASVTVSTDKVTEPYLYFEGITVTVAGLEPGDRVTNSLDDEATVARSSTVEFTYRPEGFVEPGVVDFTVTVAREGAVDQVIRSEFTLVPDPDATEGTLTMSTSRMNVSDFADKGIDFTAESFTQGGPILGFAFSDDSESALYFDGDLTADPSGRVTATVTANSDAEPTPGDYHLFVISANTEAWADFTLTEDVVQTESTNSGTESKGSKDSALPHTQNESTSRDSTPAYWSRAGSAWNESEVDASEAASLPRTGAELGALGLGGALLIAGAAMVAITAHRRSEPK